MSHTVSFEFALGKQVTIPAIKERATVMQVCFHVNGTHEYQVSYWHNGDWKTVWLPASQLKGVSDE